MKLKLMRWTMYIEYVEGENRCIHGSGGDVGREEDDLEDLGRIWRIILKNACYYDPGSK
jgi:hypothetical protein